MTHPLHGNLWVRWIGAALIGLGLIVLLGWAVGSRTLVQIHPNWVPMQGNTAAGFTLLGFCMWSASHDLHRWNTAGAVLGLLLPVLAMVEYATGARIGSGELLFDHYITDHTTRPGLMAPNTSASFILGHAAMVLPSVTARSITASLCMGAGLAGMLGYFVSSLNLHDLGEGFTAMAFHTSACFVLVGAPLALSATRPR